MGPLGPGTLAFQGPGAAILQCQSIDSAGRTRIAHCTRFQDLEIGWFDGDGKLLEVAPLRANDAQVDLPTFTRGPRWSASMIVNVPEGVRLFRERAKPGALGTRAVP